MAIKSVAFPLLSGAVLLLGYALFARLRSKPRELPSEQQPSRMHGAPHAVELEQMPEVLVLNLSSAAELGDDEAQSARATHIRALFLARLTEALSPFHNPGLLAQVSR